MDRKARNILFNTYWKKGWLPAVARYTHPADLAYAISMGVMFTPYSITHDACIAQIMSLREELTPEITARAFLGSLTAARPELRSAIISAFMAQQLQPHPFYEDKAADHPNVCAICRQQGGITGEALYHHIDLNMLNFERLKWGGTRHRDLIYILFDLQQFRQLLVPMPTLEDLTMFSALLEVIAASFPGDTPAVLEKKLKAVFPVTKTERQLLIEVLACMGVLQPAYNHKDKNQVQLAAGWRGADKYNKAALQSCFQPYIHLLTASLYR
ncbi:hypothetical protein [Chitinophaga nivalis]|uniref:Uncharacterized protein n=1 Tax=Chitinophaga nivalis TaxID=2991709 RepID=A0ABT3IQ92_9BACT|nr:hypothetical protein [Chitinophaga nivalis]MCW3464164.1 hypothetical protein [Chitinophaga nivalis]MCW3486146.1 hypothetical protein [Chitinophaga nivalis]